MNEGNDYNQGTPQEPQYGPGPNQPQPPYGAPQQPQYGQPEQQPQYGQPQQPQYGQPQQPQYGQQPYGAPQEPQYGQPQAPQYGQQQEPQYGPPQEPQYGQPQYGQQQEPQYGQPQYDQQQYQPQYGGPELPPPKKSKLPAILIAAVLVVAVGVGAFFFLGRGGGDKPGSIGGVSYKQDPEKYLQASVEKTTQNIFGVNAEGEPDAAAVKSGFPDLDRFSGKPAEYSLSLDLRSLYGANELAGASGDLIIRADTEANKYLLDLSVGYAGINLKNNQLFLSKDLLGLSVPDLYTRNKYITVNPQTFVDQWNSSELGAMAPLDLDAMGLGELEAMMGSLGDTTAMEEASQKMIDSFTAMGEEFQGKAAFKDEGTETITVNGKQIEAAKMSYSMSPEDIKTAYLGVTKIMRDFMGDYTDYLVGIGAAMGGGYYNPYEDMADELDYLFEEINSLVFPEGITYYYYVDTGTGLLSRMSVGETKMAIEDYPDDVVSFSFDLDMIGEGVVTDNFLLTMRFQDSYDNDFEMSVKNLMVRGNKPSWEFVVTASEREEEAFTLTMNGSWDPSASGENFSAGFEVYDGWTRVGLGLKGNMTDSSDGVKVKDGLFEATEDDEVVAAVGFSFGLRSISASDVDIDRSQAADFFTLDLNQLQQDISENLTKVFAMM